MHILFNFTAYIKLKCSNFIKSKKGKSWQENCVAFFENYVRMGNKWSSQT